MKLAIPWFGQLMGGSDLRPEIAQLKARLAAKESEIERLSDAHAQANEQVHKLSDQLKQALRSHSLIQRFSASIDGYQQTFSLMVQFLDGERDNIVRLEKQKSSSEATLSGIVSGLESISASIQGTSGLIDALKNHSEQISETTSNVKDVADTTNLLSLNANIEAARAGEHGRGFTVVANEVRSLANRTSDLTEQISKRVDLISNSVNTASQRSKQDVALADQNIARAKTFIDGAMSEGAKLAKTRGDMLKVSLLAEIELANLEELQLRIAVFQAVFGLIPLHSVALVSAAQCGIGRWYYAEHFRQLFQHNPDYKALESPHNRVHEHATNAIAYAGEGNSADAMSQLEAMEQHNEIVCGLIANMTRSIIAQVE